MRWLVYFKWRSSYVVPFFALIWYFNGFLRYMSCDLLLKLLAYKERCSVERLFLLVPSSLITTLKKIYEIGARLPKLFNKQPLARYVNNLLNCFLLKNVPHTVVSYSDENFSIQMRASCLPLSFHQKRGATEREEGCKIGHSHLNETLPFE